MNSAVWLFYWKKIEGRFKMIQIIENKRLSEEEINLLSDALRVSDKAFAEVKRCVEKGCPHCGKGTLVKEEVTCINCRYLEFLTEDSNCTFRCLTHGLEIFLPKNAGCEKHEVK